MSGGGARVSIPSNVRKMIGEIKMIAGKYSDEFINALLKECNMDSNEVVQRLKMIQDIKEIAKKHNNDDIHTMLKECNMDPNEAAQRLLYIDTFHEVKKKRDKRNVNASSGTYEDYRRTSGKQWPGARGSQGNYYPSKVSNAQSSDVGGRRTVWKENGVGNRNRTERVSSSTIPVQHNKENNVAPRPANSSPVRVNGPTVSADGFSSHGSANQQSAVSDVYSCASDPVVIPSMNSQNAGVLGTKNSEVDNESGFAEAVATPLFGSSASAVQDVAITSEAGTGSPSAVQDVAITSEAGTGSPSVNSNDDFRPPHNLNGTLKVVASEPVTATVAVSDSVLGRESMLEESNLNLEMKLEKLTLSANMPVIFPDNLQVPETFKKRLTFGSLEAAPSEEGSSSSIEPVQGNDVMEPSQSSQNVAPIVREDGFPDHHSLPPPNLPENALLSEDSVLSDSSLTQEQPKQETVPPHQFSFVHSTTNYGFGLPPHYVGLLHPEVPEHQSGNPLVSSTSAPTPSATQSSGAAQNSPSPPPFPLFRHPYAHTYFPYGPYYPQFYWPPNAHHLMGHGGFPQQPYVAPPGVKFPIPSPYMQGANAGNLGHFGIPSAYGTYGSSPVGYTADATPGSSGNEDAKASQTKEKNINPVNSVVQQGEDSHVWASAPGRDIPNYFYSLPQGQHMAFSPAIYHHPSQTMAAQSTVLPPLHQSEAMAAGSVEAPVGPPSNSYEQPQRAPQITWNILNSRENI